MTDKPEKNNVAAWTGLARAYRLAVSRIEARLKAADLPPLSWYDALWELEKKGEAGLRPFELERSMLFEQYNLSRLVDRLERGGFVARGPCLEDRRGHVLSITDAGRALRRSMWAVYGPAIDEVLSARLSPAEAAMLAALPGRLA